MKKILLIFLLLLFTQNGFSNTWSIQEQKDDFKGTSIKYAISNPVKPNAPLDFPYEDMEAEFIKICDDTSMIIYFTNDPNLLDGDLSDNYSTFYADVKLDGKFDSLTLRQDWGSKYLYIRNTKKLINIDEFIIQLKHYGGTRHYKFNLSDLPC
tara:strand:+ start:101 stop:559 length:459 start_codon:yes stop_codon:yes gene_type:complete